MEDKIQAFRQPLVTATGIILGFMLSFTASWVKSDSPLTDRLAYFAAACLVVGTVSLILVLYRILRMDYPRDRAKQYCSKTLALFITGVSIAFVGVFVDLTISFMAG